MSLLEFTQLILRNRKWIFYFPFLVSIAVFFSTRNLPHSYSSQTVIYTGIASGFNPDNGFDNKLDFHAANSRFDNLINIICSKETRKDIAIELLAYIIHDNSARVKMLSSVKSKKLDEILTEEFINKYKYPTIESIKDSLNTALESSPDNEIYKLIYGHFESPFNITTLAGLRASRLGSSDMLKIEYTSEDPLICKKTLDFTTEIFLRKYQNVRIGEADVALKYFLEQTSLAKNQLHKSEESLKHFRSSNGLINYYEQTKYVADQKDDIEKNVTHLKMDLDGYQSALKKVESKLGNRTLLQLQNEKIIQTRNALSGEFERSGYERAKSGSSGSDSSSISVLKEELKNNVENIYSLTNSVEGLPTRELLQQWIQLTLNVDETRSKLAVLEKYQLEFDKVFDRFAPLGSDLNKLERDVDVNEKEYLNLLHSLSQAILRKNNLQASENISVVDGADLPLTPNPSKRILLILMSGLSCAVISVVIVMIKQFLDQSIGSPLNLEKITGISVITAFSKREFEVNVLHEMDNRSIKRWGHFLKQAEQNCEQGSNSFLIPFNSSTENLKPYLTNLLELNSHLDLKWNFNETTINKENEIGLNLVVTDNKFPEQYTSKMLGKTCSFIFIFDAAKKLDEYEMQILEKWKSLQTPLRAILVNTSEVEISKYLGEIPKKRSAFRSFMKRQILRYAN